MTSQPALSALALVCSLKPTPAESSSHLLAEQVLDALAQHGVSGKAVRVIDRSIAAGVTIDEGDGDDWPELRRQMLSADILLFATPTWVGQPSSVCQRILERLDGELSEADDAGRSPVYNKVAVAAIVGNEDGAHHITGVLWQVLNDVGFTVPAAGVTYWNGEAMHGVDFKDLDDTPEGVRRATSALARNAAHLARLLRANPYPAA